MLKWYEETGDNADVVISSRIRLARNLKNYPFPPKLSLEESETIVNELEKKLEDFAGVDDKAYYHIRVSELGVTDRVALVERHLLSETLITGKAPAGAIISTDESVSVMLNEEDHIRIQAMAGGMNLKKAWRMANYIDDAVNHKFPYAFHEKMGYLTSFPTNVGTGLRASYMLHLPALAGTRKLSGIASDIGRFGVTIRGINTENGTGIGNLYQIYNQNTLGPSEEEIIKSLTTIANQIIKQERRIRVKLIKENELGITDTIYRSYGVLKYCKTLEIEAAMNLLSDIQFGIACDILKVESKDLMCVYPMMMGIQPAHLAKRAGRQLGEEERDICRADYIHEYLPECI